MHRLKTLVAALGVLSLLSFAPAYSQDQPTAFGISDQKLDQVAAAIARIDRLQKTYQRKLEQTPPNEQDRVIEQAQNALGRAVADQGLSIDEYDTIVRTAKNDSALREKLLQRLRVRQRSRAVDPS